ncbi:MAG: aminotransferase class III-fold pyridoxal phosphate-dependent enzyme [Pseudomonadota bacterium]
MNALNALDDTEALLERRERLLGKAYRLFYDRPVHIVSGEGAWLTGADGQRYLDSYNNVPHVGHCHPRVVEAISRQAATLNTHTRYLHEAVLDYAELLLARFPAAFDIAMFSCTGSEANELALRIARAASGGSGVIAVYDAYHGNSQATAELSCGVGGAHADHLAFVPCPDPYRGEHRGDDAGERFAKAVEGAIATLQERGHPPAAFIIDTILSSNGLPNIPSDWLGHVVPRIRAAGGLFIADEVQPGFGRMGDAFWGWERLGVQPDIVTMGKPMANGHPVSAVVTSAEVLDAFQQQSGYFNTFGGNPVSCAAARAVLEVIEEEGLQQHALAVGAYLRRGLRALQDRYPLIGEVRGSGLFNAVDLVEDRETRAPDRDAATRVVNGLRDRRVLIGASGPHGNVLKLRSPLVFGRSEADFLLERLDTVLAELAGSGQT